MPVLNVTHFKYFFKFFVSLLWGFRGKMAAFGVILLGPVLFVGFPCFPEHLVVLASGVSKLGLCLCGHLFPRLFSTHALLQDSDPFWGGWLVLTLRLGSFSSVFFKQFGF